MRCCDDIMGGFGERKFIKREGVREKVRKTFERFDS